MKNEVWFTSLITHSAYFIHIYAIFLLFSSQHQPISLDEVAIAASDIARSIYL
jgi:hypothetical protein